MNLHAIPLREIPFRQKTGCYGNVVTSGSKSFGKLSDDLFASANLWVVHLHGVQDPQAGGLGSGWRGGTGPLYNAFGGIPSAKEPGKL